MTAFRKTMRTETGEPSRHRISRKYQENVDAEKPTTCCAPASAIMSSIASASECRPARLYRTGSGTCND